MVREQRVDLDGGDGLFSLVTLLDDANAVDGHIRLYFFQRSPYALDLLRMDTAQGALQHEKVILCVPGRFLTEGGPGLHTRRQRAAQLVTQHTASTQH